MRLIYITAGLTYKGGIPAYSCRSSLHLRRSVNILRREERERKGKREGEEGEDFKEEGEGEGVTAHID